ncbi:MAG: ion channel [Solirubrobacteraceae bacterium]|jgi:voltage-gated potassium channel
MSLFLVAAHLAKRVGRHRVQSLVALATAIVLGGAGLFSLAEHMSYAAALYWAVTTATTVGYGDITPHTTLGRMIASGVMLTTIPIVGAVFALVAGASVLATVRRLLGLDTNLPAEPYVVVYGSHPVLPRVLAELVGGDDPVVLVAPTAPAAHLDDVTLLAGDPTDDELVRRSEPTRACRALIACTDDADTLVVAVAVHSLAPALEVYALTQTPKVARALRDLGITHTLAGEELIGHTLAKSLETPQAGDLLLQLVDTTSYRLIEAAVDPDLVAQPLSRARQSAGTLVLGISRGDHVDLGVGDDPVLAAGDRLIVLRATA